MNLLDLIIYCTITTADISGDSAIILNIPIPFIEGSITYFLPVQSSIDLAQPTAAATGMQVGAGEADD